MPPTPKRPKSTLSASKALAAKTAWDLSAVPKIVPKPFERDLPSYAKPQLPPQPQPPRAPAGGTKAAWELPGSRPAPRAQMRTGPAQLAVSTAKQSNGNAFVAGAVMVFVAFAAVAGAVSVKDTMAESSARTSIVGALQQVNDNQNEFRNEQHRFASWPELEKRGMRLPPNKQVLRSNADASHWFISVRDRKTGVVCDRVGELVDDPVVNQVVNCRSPSGQVTNPGP